MGYKNIKSLGESLNELVHQLKLEDKIIEANIKEGWKQVMGHNIFVLTNDISFRNGRLTVYLKSSVLRNELYMSKQKVISAVNEYLRTESVKDVSFK